MSVMTRFLPLLLLALCTGCATYEFDITSPQDQVAHIGRKADTESKVEPLIYKWRAVDNRLVVRAFNPTSELITLLGNQSTVVDPQGQSHPLRGQPIAPNSFAKVILPPPRPRVYDHGPTFGVGVGMHVDRQDLGYPNDPWYDEPRYLTVYADGDAFYWDWNGESEVRLTLVYQRGEQTFKHEFTIKRVKI